MPIAGSSTGALRTEENSIPARQTTYPSAESFNEGIPMGQRTASEYMSQGQA